jgi:hypothetical protein
VSFALEGLADDLEPATLIAQIQRRWPAAAGAFAGCDPVFERDGELTVNCGSAVQAQELDLMSKLVVDRLNAALGQPAVKCLRPRATRG